jgi:hypothetical protein
MSRRSYLKATSDFALSPTCCRPSRLGSQLELAPCKRPCRGQQHHADQKSDHDILGNGYGVSITPQSQPNILMWPRYREHHVEDSHAAKFPPTASPAGSLSAPNQILPAAGFGLSVSNCTVFRTSATILHLSQSTVRLDILTS